MKQPDDKPPLSRSDVAAILDVGRTRAALLLRLKQAILDGDSLMEHQLAREIVGLPKEVTQ